MNVGDLQFGVDGIQVTSFEGPRRQAPETARQQCSCGSVCYSDCLGSCGVECEVDCYNQCGNNWEVQATLADTPHSVSTSGLMSNNNSFSHSYEY